MSVTRIPVSVPMRLITDVACGCIEFNQGQIKEHKDLFTQILHPETDFIEAFAQEVIGNFDERVYGFATRVLPSVGCSV